MSKIVGNLHVDGVLTAKVFSPPALSVGAAALTSNLQLGMIQLPLVSWREIITADIPNIAGNGGLLAKDTSPIMERINVGTDPQIRIRWAATNVDPISISVVSPQDLASGCAVYLRAKMAAATDTPVIGVDIREDVGASSIGGNTGALSDTISTVSRSFTPTATAAVLKAWTITLTPAAHGTDALDLYGAWIVYTRG